MFSELCCRIPQEGLGFLRVCQQAAFGCRAMRNVIADHACKLRMADLVCSDSLVLAQTKSTERHGRRAVARVGLA